MDGRGEDPFAGIFKGYLNDEVMPNLSCQTTTAIALPTISIRPLLIIMKKMMTRHAILAAYSGPITLYYGDEFGDDTRCRRRAER